MSLDVPIEDPRFGRAVPCPNPQCAEGQARKQRRADQVFKRSNMGERYLRYALRDFEAFQPAAFQAARRLLLDGGIETPVGRKVGVWFFGRTGTGKSTLATAITQEYLRAGYDVLFAFVPDLLDDIRASYRRDERREDEDAIERDPLEAARRVTLLVLDDLGAERGTDWAVETLSKLVNFREANALTTIVTSNQAPEDMLTEAELNDNYAMQRIVSRLTGLCLPVLMDGADMRMGA